MAEDVPEMLNIFREYILDLADYHGITGEGFQEVTRRAIELLNKLIGVMGAADGIIESRHVLFLLSTYLQTWKKK